MNRQDLRLTVTITLFGLLCGMFGGHAPAKAEDKKQEFPSTKQEIVRTLQRKGVHRKGPLDIADDYENLVKENPTAKASIYFEFDSATIGSKSYPLLEEYAKALQDELKHAVLIIAGHTDDIGSADYNLTLSQRRAEAVKQFLVSQHQIDETRLKIQAYGESQPIEASRTREARTLNRRVEFINIH